MNNNNGSIYYLGPSFGFLVGKSIYIKNSSPVHELVWYCTVAHDNFVKVALLGRDGEDLLQNHHPFICREKKPRTLVHAPSLPLPSPFPLQQSYHRTNHMLCLKRIQLIGCFTASEHKGYILLICLALAMVRPMYVHIERLVLEYVVLRCPAPRYLPMRYTQWNIDAGLNVNESGAYIFLTFNYIPWGTSTILWL